MNKKSGETILEEDFLVKKRLGFVNPEMEIVSSSSVALWQVKPKFSKRAAKG